jgi:hypothetical protein
MKYSVKDGFETMDYQRVTDMLAKAFWAPGYRLMRLSREPEIQL